MESNKSPQKKNRIYSFFYKILVTPPLSIASIVFSHGLTHFFILLITGFITGWLFFENSTIDIRPHHIGIDLSWTNTYLAIMPEGTISVEDSIRNLNIHMELNSNDAIKTTNGKYKHRLVFEFDGGKQIERPQRNGLHYALLCDPSQGKEDSVMIKIFSDPKLSDACIDIVPENCILDESKIGSNWNAVTDSLSNIIGFSRGLPLYFISEPDTTKYVCQRENNDSLFTIKLIPAKYDVNGKMKSPRQKVSIYSNDFGVDKNNPYYYYFIAFPSSKLSGSLKFEFKASDLTHPEGFNFAYANNSHLQYNYVFPQPDIINNGYVEYHTPEKKDAIQKNHGIIIQAVDVKSLNHLNNLSFLYSVLVGTGLAFLIDVFIQLIKELRRVNQKAKKQDD